MDISMSADTSVDEQEIATSSTSCSQIKPWCDPCLFDETKGGADGFCWTCVEYLCPNCIKEHRKAKMTRKHSVQQHSFPKNAEALRDIKAMITCPLHANMTVTHHCENHEVYLCSLCRVDTHKECRNISTLDTKEQTEKEFNDMQKELDIIAHATNVIRKCRTENITGLYEDQEHIFRQRSFLLKEILKTSKDKAKASAETIAQEIEKDVQELNEIENLQREYQGILEAALKNDNKEFAYVVAFVIKDRLKTFRNRVASLQTKRYERLVFKTPHLSDFQPLVDVSVIRTDTIVALSEKEETQSCMHDQNEARLAKPSKDLSPCVKPTRRVTSRSVSNMERLVSVMSYNVKDVSDRDTCTIIGSVLLQNGQLLLIDQENSKLKLLAKDFSLVFSLQLPGNPLRMCAIGPDTVAVIFENMRKIERYNVRCDSLLYEGGFKTRLHNHCIAYDGKNIIAIVSDEEFCCCVNAKEDILEIHIIDALTGEVIDIVRDFKAVGKRKWPITLNNIVALQLTDNNDILIAEFNRVLCFEFIRDVSSSKMIAQEKSYYICGKDIPKDDIENIASDNDNVYVCAGSGKVLRLSATNYRKRRIILSGLGIITSLAVDKQNGRLIIGCEDEDNIHVYGFE